MCRSLTVIALVAIAAPSRSQDCDYTTTPNPIHVRQPNGREIELRFRGSASNHWYEDPAGFLVARDGETFVYARLGPNGRPVGTSLVVGTDDPAPAGIPARVVPTPPDRGPFDDHVRGGASASPTPTQGPVRNLVLLARFADHGGEALPTWQDIDVIFSQAGGDPTLAPKGSVRDFFSHNSGSDIDLQSTVFGWFDLPETEAYYADGSCGGRADEMVTDVLDAADPTVDFTLFDFDADGIVDVLTVLHSGYAAEFGRTECNVSVHDRIWSHKDEVSWTSTEGVSAHDYATTAARWGTSGSDPARIGVICHEIGHVLGLPDLYDTDKSSEGIGFWGLMGNGHWGFDGQGHGMYMSAWSRLRMGWAEPRVLPTPSSELLFPPGVQQAHVWVVDNGYPPGEYLLVENRQPLWFDDTLPEGGLCIWHVDELVEDNRAEGHPGNGTWPDGDHYKVRLIQEDGFFELERNVNRGDADDVHEVGEAATQLFSYQHGIAVNHGTEITNTGEVSLDVWADVTNPLAPTIAQSPIAPFRWYAIQAGHANEVLPGTGTGPFAWSEFIQDPSYSVTVLDKSEFEPNRGAARGWQGDADDFWRLDLPFPFPFYDSAHTEVWVGAGGVIDFVPGGVMLGAGDLEKAARISPLQYRFLSFGTQGGGHDVYVDDSVPGEVYVRWAAGSVLKDAAFAVLLRSDGTIRFDYGVDDVASVGPPRIVGLIGDHNRPPERLASHEAATDVDHADSVLFTLEGSDLPDGLEVRDVSGSLNALMGVPTEAGSFGYWLKCRGADRNYEVVWRAFDVIADCDNNGIDDATDIAGGTYLDCNLNGAPDDCEIASGTSADCNANSTPDECEDTPMAYCVGKLNTAGCVPQMTASGLASVTCTDPFLLGTYDVVNQKAGLIFYGTNGAAGNPFMGGTLCVQLPIRRLPKRQSGGSANPKKNCSGSYSYDFNDRIQSGVDPALMSGVQVWSQCWYRDPQSSFTVGLSNGMTFTIAP